MTNRLESYNEWGQLREALIGIEDHTVEPAWVDALKWLPPEGQEYCRRYGGKATEEIFPEKVRQIRNELDLFVTKLESLGVKVYRTRPVPYELERQFLGPIQEGNMLFGGADFLRVIGTQVLLLNSFRLPFRRKQVWPVQRVLDEIAGDGIIRYSATPPPSPDDSDPANVYLENGDIMVAGFDVFVGMSGNASNRRGMEWLQGFLGPDYRVWDIPLRPDLFHLDWIMTLNRPGLLTYAPEALTAPLPEPLRNWDKIEITLDEARKAGANNLTINPDTIIVPFQHQRIAAQYVAKGLEVILVPTHMTIEYGSGPRCLTCVLRRDP
jgi:N-dimethylarginine dimethylaminohydrolase